MAAVRRQMGLRRSCGHNTPFPQRRTELERYAGFAIFEDVARPAETDTAPR